MKITWDAKAKAGYIRLSNRKVFLTTHYNNGIRLDEGRHGELVGIEVLNVESKPEIMEP